MKLDPVKKVADKAALRHLQLTIQSHINALETWGATKENFGSLLGTKLYQLISTELQKEWSRGKDNDVTDIEDLLEFIREQVEAAERFNRWRAETPKPTQ